MGLNFLFYSSHPPCLKSNLTQRRQCEEPQGVSHTQKSELWATSLLKSSFHSLSFFLTLLRFSWFWILSAKRHASLFPSAFYHTLSPKFIWNPKSFPLFFLLTMPFPFIPNWSLSFHKTPSEPIALLCLSYITAQADAMIALFYFQTSEWLHGAGLLPKQLFLGTPLWQGLSREPLTSALLLCRGGDVEAIEQLYVAAVLPQLGWQQGQVLTNAVKQWSTILDQAAALTTESMPGRVF